MKRGINIVSKGTDNHLMLLDLRSLNLTGKAAEKLLDEVQVTCNKNTIPFDPESPFCNKWHSVRYASRDIARNERG